MRTLVFVFLLAIAGRAEAQTTAQAFFNKYQAQLKQQFGGLATDAELKLLLSQIIDQKNLAADYNDYYNPPNKEPLTHLIFGQRKGEAIRARLKGIKLRAENRQQLQSTLSPRDYAELIRVKDNLVYPLLRFVLPKTTPTPIAVGKLNTGEQIAVLAYRYLGVQYGPLGAGTYNPKTDTGRLDCSGLVNLVLRNLGLTYKRGSGANAVSGLVNSPDFVTVTGTPQPGDLLIRQQKSGHYSHVGIYSGNNKLIEAPYSGTVVRTTDYKPEKWARIIRYTGGK
ncbi:hypothetical protein GCM10023189_49670 [Nibrella saemangeumensis]|uniref:NlpC/P60 domain-containing protein n=1 Tax=Nibrella saemangeumensis TaxID=1084526 RepID=A0ABP8NKF0_9BACT